MNKFFDSGGKTIPDKAVLETYKELTVRVLNGTGGSPARKTPETAIKVQTERLEMINKALQGLE